MQLILTARREIYDQFHSSNLCQKELFRQENSDRYAAYYTAMYLIQDTGEAVLTHMGAGFSLNPFIAYIEIWGIMQALCIQQDSITELYSAITGQKLKDGKAERCAWETLRENRNILVGHPAKKAIPKDKPTRRSFMGRSFGTYDRIQYETWNGSDLDITHPVFNLRSLITAYDDEAARVPVQILTEMKTKWPTSKPRL